MGKRIVALLLALVSSFALFALSGCEKLMPNNSNNEKEQAQTPTLAKGERILSECSEELMIKYRAIYQETGCNPVVDASNYYDKVISLSGTKNETKRVYTDVIINKYYATGCTYYFLTLEEFENIQKYQNETGKQVIYPMVESSWRNTTFTEPQRNDGNFYYSVNFRYGKAEAVLTPEGNVIPNYWKLEAGKTSVAAAEYNSLRIEGEDGFVEDGKQYYYVYGKKVESGVEVRLFCYAYYQYLKDTSPDPIPPEEEFVWWYEKDTSPN